MKYKNLEAKVKEAVIYSKRKEAKIVTTVDGYITDDEALKLRDFLWYARDNGVEVVFVSNKVKECDHVVKYWCLKCNDWADMDVEGCDYKGHQIVAKCVNCDEFINEKPKLLIKGKEA